MTMREKAEAELIRAKRDLAHADQRITETRAEIARRAQVTVGCHDGEIVASEGARLGALIEKRTCIGERISLLDYLLRDDPA